ncbi:tRNA (5-methylaminomethyl-2-thiouridine)(34)-methyltransferase MnmD [Adhaeribacter soli]|uniref:tRNA (5-methylaminomethyl-2-thiouridine)(34)-methyltransferase MnmD n=1 Tax=Adhaeribacter soli TaxID=2607655 RepID=A0A5N1J0S1_9BACT|nr:tRNA (5-methylaminomethyl-2-thiouridine)(34)-methyltransferase MnmD [Adhaeribacter soli]KAA9340295.1 tRNA (5-methylaminomethyl-2-thiouridine)(34)-methyltransferase MnmD [Adhaeribacter soli]
MKVEVKQTNDGSHTLYVPALNEHYHSVHGALQEALHVFIKHGLEPVLANATTPINLLEIGFGTGLNAILTLQAFLTQKHSVLYDTLEKYPLPEEVIAQLQFENFILNPELLAYFRKLHAAPWNTEAAIRPNFTLQKLHADLENFALPANTYDLVYFDAFAPEKQPELWTDEIFAKIGQALKPGGVLVSYCAKGSFKRSLKAAGLTVEALPGPPGKREMTRARK